MYIPRHFAETRVEVMHDLMRAHPLVTLVTVGPSGLNANHIPMYLSPGPDPNGRLWGHVSRANPLLKDVAEHAEALAIFHGPDAYISPSWYPTKAETGRSVPTWNYVVVHAHGMLRAMDDVAWLRAHLDELTTIHESPFPEPWSVSDAPADYIEKQLAAIVGLELEIRSLTGKWKVSQNQPAANRIGVVQGLRGAHSPPARAIADLVEERSRPGA